MDKTITINIVNNKITIIFKGIWSRRDIDKAYMTALKALPQHIVEKQKAEVAKQNITKK